MIVVAVAELARAPPASLDRLERTVELAASARSVSLRLGHRVLAVVAQQRGATRPAGLSLAA